METISRNTSGAAVEDVQQRLVLVGLLQPEDVDGVFGDKTAAAVRSLCEMSGLPVVEEVTEKVWAALVDASFSLGDRTLYLRMPYFHGHDVHDLQTALSALGFSCGGVDGIFGAYTEQALRKFQLNMGLPSDGIAGAYTYACIRNLSHSWEGKSGIKQGAYLGFARIAGVLEANALCLFGVTEFTRDVARRMSNLAIATNPASKVTSADSLLVSPDENMILVRLALPGETVSGIPLVSFDDQDSLATRLRGAIVSARKRGANSSARIAIQLPGDVWQDAGPDRSAQHYAISLLDALCSALAE